MFSHYLQSKVFVLRTTCRGFGLVELLISISIVMLVSAIVLARHESFNGAILLRNEAYDIALTLREAQLSAVSVQGDVGTFRQLTGIYLSSDAASDVGNKKYIVFHDAQPYNAFYDSTEDTIVGPPRALDQRFEISEIRADGSVESEISIIYVRPNFDARFFVGKGASNEIAASAVEIDIKRVGVNVDPADPGTVRTVEVTATGQIAVQ